jgi:polysaccharide export outer membrane protein
MTSIRTYAVVILLALSTPLRLFGQTPAPPTPPGGDQIRPQDPRGPLYAETLTTGRVYITGQINKPGPYALKEKMTVSDLITLAGGVGNYAKIETIAIVRSEGGKPVVFKFNYTEVLNQEKLEQNIELKPGDTVVVP